MVIIRIKNLGNSLRNSVLAQSLCIVTLIEHSHIEGRRLCLPQTEYGNRIVAVAGNVHIIRYSLNCVVVCIGNVVILVIPVFCQLALKVNVNSLVGFWNKPCFAAGEPVVRELCLPAIFNLLLEDTVFVADGVTHCRITVCSKTVEITSSKTAKTAVAEACIRLILVNSVDVYAEFGKCFFGNIINLKVKKACLEGTSHKEFHREVVNFLLTCRLCLCACFAASFTEYFNNYSGKSLVILIVGSFVRSNVELNLEFVDKLFLESFLADNRHHNLHLLQSYVLISTYI